MSPFLYQSLLSLTMIPAAVFALFIVSEFGTDNMVANATQSMVEEPAKTAGDKVFSDKHVPTTDAESINRGEKLFQESCSFCHDPYSTNVVVGPGLKGILKNPALPISKSPSTPENIAAQLSTPYKRMPSFSNLSQENVTDLISFLNTL